MSLAFVDTNILLYATRCHDDNIGNHRIARNILDCDAGLALSVQVLQEFFIQATRPSRPDALTSEEAVGLIRVWRRFPVQDNNLVLFDLAVGIHARERFSFWDCMVVAAAQALGCTTLYSEDMDDGRMVERLRIVNPFREDYRAE